MCDFNNYLKDTIVLKNELCVLWYFIQLTSRRNLDILDN